MSSEDVCCLIKLRLKRGLKSERLTANLLVLALRAPQNVDALPILFELLSQSTALPINYLPSHIKTCFRELVAVRTTN